MAIEKIEALLSLVPTADCVMKGGVITVWNSEEAQPTDAEIINTRPIRYAVLG